MKIITKEPDYYDYINVGLEQDVDEKTVFYKRKEVAVRHFVDLTISSNIVEKKHLTKKTTKEEEDKFLELNNKFTEELRMFLVKNDISIFVMDLYNGIFNCKNFDYSKDNNKFKRIETNILFIADSIKVLFNVYQYEKVSKTGYREHLLKENISIEELKGYMKDYRSKQIMKLNFKDYEKLETLNPSNLLVNMDCPIIVLNNNNGENIVKFNANLKKYDFERIVDPYSMHQNIEMFISQQLTKREVINEVPNEAKITNHGFDIKKSFRHR